MTNRFALALEELPSAAELNQAKQALEDRLCETGNQLACKNWGLFDDEILRALSEALQGLDLVGLLGQAWAAAKELRALGQQTAADGTTERLKLGQHPLAIDLHPVVTVKLAKFELPELRFTLRIAGDIAWAVLVVERGVLSSLEKANLTLNASLLYGEQVIKGPISHEWPVLEPYRFPDGGYRLADLPAPPA